MSQLSRIVSHSKVDITFEILKSLTKYRDYKIDKRLINNNSRYWKFRILILIAHRHKFDAYIFREYLPLILTCIFFY